MEKNEQKYTEVGTDIEAMKKLARKSGLTYNEAIEYIAKTTGGHGTNVYSDTNIETVKRKIVQSEQAKRH